jgi:dTDP-4-amino-4,6-dideoxygalactose transaminase
MPVLLPKGVDRSQVISGLRKHGIISGIHYPPVHSLTYFRARFPGVNLTNTEQFSSRELSLPLHPALKEEEVQRVVRNLKDVIS